MKKNYSWIICGLCVLLAFCSCGLVTVAFSTYLPFLKEAAELTATETSMITTIRCLSTIIFMIVSGKYYKKFSLRTGSILALMTLSIAYFIFAHAHTAFTCYIAAFISGIPYALGNTISIAQIIRNWFKSKEATALSIAMCGTGVSTAVMPPIITKLVDSVGLATAFYAVAAFAIVSGILIFFLLRDKPEELGYEPYQDVKTERKKEKKTIVKTTDFLSGKRIILFLVVALLIGGAGTPYTNHLSLHYSSVGYTTIQAALAISVYGVLLMISKIVYGAGVDHFGAYKVNYLFFITWILASGMTIFLHGTSIGMLYGSAVFNGIGISLGTIGITVWTRDFSSDAEYARRVKMTQTLFQVGSFAGSPVPGLIADKTGSYARAYVLFTAILILIFVIIQGMYQRQRKAEAERAGA